MTYPDPDALREYAEEPMPFHDIGAADLRLVADRLLAEFDHVRYVYAPTQICVEVEDGEWEYIDGADGFELTHEEAWSRAIDLQIEEDFVCVTEFLTKDGRLHMFDAYWVLDHVVIKKPR